MYTQNIFGGKFLGSFHSLTGIPKCRFSETPPPDVKHTLQKISGLLGINQNKGVGNPDVARKPLKA